MLPINATPAARAELARAVHAATGLHRPGPADIAADYVPCPPPPNFLGRYRMPPQQLFHLVACYLESPSDRRPPVMILDARPSSVPVHILCMEGFHITVEIPSLGGVFDFDLADAQFCLGFHDPQSAKMATAEVTARVQANYQLCGKSEQGVEASLAQIKALLSLPEDARAAIVISNRQGTQTVAHVRDARGTCVIVEVADGPFSGRHVFDLANEHKGLNFIVSQADAAAHVRYLHAAEQAGKPFPVLAKA